MQCVLIVDDIPENLYFLEVLLKGNGFDVRSAKNGAEALQTARRRQPDLVVADILMPVMDGYSLCREWRADPDLKRIPFIFYTATYTSKSDEALALSLGADRFIIKPQEPDAMMAIIREALAVSCRNMEPLANDSAEKENEQLKAYNETLFHKLEKKMADLERVNRELEERVSQRTSELTKKVAELDAFTSAVSHDLQAPMRQLSSYSRMLTEKLQGRLEDDEAELLEKIVRKSATAMEMVDALLELSRLEKAHVSRKEVDLSAMAAEILAELSATEPKRHFQPEIDSGLLVNADWHMMRILLTNLLGNAWKYCANQEETRISLTAVTGCDGTIFCISDNGAGFDMKFAENLFKPFQRLHRQDEFDGIGIGLATVNSIVRLHGGHIWAQSDANSGAKFYFTLACVCRTEPDKDSIHHLNTN